MSWTDERIELLQKMWLQGMSASKIASELADGLTRNAVIGKVYRLGLSGRGKAEPQPDEERPAPRLAARETDSPLDEAAPEDEDRDAAPPEVRCPARAESVAAVEARPAPFAELAGPAFVSGANALAVARAQAPAPASAPQQNVVAMTPEPVTIMELREFMCRWPLGDPTQAEFRFCGARRPIGGGPYCACHAALAYQPQHDRRRQRVQRPA
ncbi:GcrA family cell cycle regulator [Methylocella sp.]|uniref:GcrA family cell cycle regulator n=1 Tax=Methylocella sp. TaxID=1978226 RepID=UPI0035B40479